jgi:predicted ATPase/DNA-binding winged helix-turn-helix (wHTH) protein
VDLGRRELRVGGSSVPIGRRAFDILELLIRSAGDIVTKDDIMDQLWPGVPVEENTLQVHISAVRKALGVDRDIVKTVSGRGYCLTGAWTALPGRAIETAARSPATASSRPFPSNIPLAASRLIGRTSELSHLGDLLSAYQVVTLTGPGGIGKTRLAQEISRSLLPRFNGEGCIVELASLSDPALVPSAVARTLCLELGRGEISAISVARAIGERRLLLVIDNCEHVIDAAAELVEAVVRTCPHASILVTSREVLRIDGEHVFRVRPLDVPLPDGHPRTIPDCSAVQLFVSRITAAQSDFSATPENLPAIGAICRRLDGIPLAIEFAAARAAALGVEQVVTRLDDRFELLTGGRRTALPRHQTLRAALDWSYQLLPDPEKRLLCALAVFAGGFTLDAAAFVVDPSGKESAKVEESIANLVAKSIVTQDILGQSSRWRLLETIREYALEKLSETNSPGQAARRHAEYFRHVLAPPDPASGRPSSTDRVILLSREIDNVRKALAWSFSDQGDVAVGIGITAGYIPIWLHFSLLAECRDCIERALRHLDAGTGPTGRTKVDLYIALGAALSHLVGLGNSTEKVLVDALTLAERLHDNEAQLGALWSLWSYRINSGKHRLAQGLAVQFRRIALLAENPDDLLHADRLMGITLHYLGDQAEARPYLERMLDQYVEPTEQRHSMWYLHDQRVVARTILARVLVLQGFVQSAADQAQACLKDARVKGQELSLCFALAEAVFPLALMRGDVTDAERSLDLLIGTGAERSVSRWQSWGDVFKGQLLIKRAEFANGVMGLRAALEERDKIGVRLRDPEFLCTLAEGLAKMGQTTEAFAILDAILAQGDRDGQRWCAAEILRIKGELLLEGPESQSVAAENCFAEALDLARQQGALFWELRVATSLAHLRVRQDRQDDARHLLEPVYNRFTEGLETTDLLVAKALLDSLSSTQDQRLERGDHAGRSLQPAPKPTLVPTYEPPQPLANARRSALS